MTKYMDLQSISPTPKASKWHSNAGDSDQESTSSINHTVKNLHFFLGVFFPFQPKKTKKRTSLAIFIHFPMLGDFPSLLVFSLRKSPNQPKARSANANTPSSKAEGLYHIATIPYTTVIVEFKWTLWAFNASMIQLKNLATEGDLVLQLSVGGFMAGQTTHPPNQVPPPPPRNKGE